MVRVWRAAGGEGLGEETTEQRWVGLRKRGGGERRVLGAVDGVVLTPGED